MNSSHSHKRMQIVFIDSIRDFLRESILNQIVLLCIVKMESVEFYRTKSWNSILDTKNTIEIKAGQNQSDQRCQVGLQLGRRIVLCDQIGFFRLINA
jgi:hypothetical protein